MGLTELRNYGITEISTVKFSTSIVREKNRYNFAGEISNWKNEDESGKNGKKRLYRYY